MRRLSAHLFLALSIAACAGISRESSPPQVEVRTGIDLGLTVSDRLEKSFTPGVWTGVRDGDIVRLEISFLVGDEGGLTRFLELDFGSSSPELLSGAVEYYDAYDDDRIIPLDTGVLELQESDPDGVVAGRWIGETDAMIRFWVDLSDHTYTEIELSQPFVLQPGGYGVFSDNLVFQYREATEDSRCPPDVTCVWEGRVAVEGQVWDMQDERPIRLRGIEAARGPVFGTHPSDLLRSGLTISLIDLSDEALATFVVTRSR